MGFAVFGPVFDRLRRLRRNEAEAGVGTGGWRDSVKVKPI